MCYYVIEFPFPRRFHQKHDFFVGFTYDLHKSALNLPLIPKLLHSCFECYLIVVLPLESSSEQVATLRKDSFY